MLEDAVWGLTCRCSAAHSLRVAGVPDRTCFAGTSSRCTVVKIAAQQGGEGKHGQRAPYSSQESLQSQLADPDPRAAFSWAHAIALHM